MAKNEGGAAATKDTNTPKIEETVAQTGQALAEASGTELDAGPDFDSLMEGQAGAGLENVTARDLLIPRLTILQGLSPQVTAGNAAYNEEARPGLIYDTALGELMGHEITIIPVHYAKVWLEWAPRVTGKGLVAIHNDPKILDKCKADEKNPLKMITPDGNSIRETAQVFCLNVEYGFRKSFWGTSSTQLKKSRRLMTLASAEKLANGRTPPLFYRSYKLGTVPETNSQGNWVGWKVERGPRLDNFPNWQAIYADCVNFRDALIKGTLRADVSSMGDEEQHGEDTPF